VRCGTGKGFSNSNDQGYLRVTCVQKADACGLRMIPIFTDCRSSNSERSHILKFTVTGLSQSVSFLIHRFRVRVSHTSTSVTRQKNVNIPKKMPTFVCALGRGGRVGDSAAVAPRHRVESGHWHRSVVATPPRRGAATSAIRGDRGLRGRVHGLTF
jgi:hypothetical protein